MTRFLLLFFLSFSVLATEKQPPYRFDLTGLQIGQVIQIFYADAFQKPFLLSPEVLEDRRPVSLRVQGSAAQVRADFVQLLDAFGYSVIRRNGVDTVLPKKEPAPAPSEYFLYRPLYRDVAYLSETLAPLFQGKFSVDRGISVPGQTPVTGAAPSGSAASLLSRDADQLVYVGTKAEIANLRALLPQVDVALGEVMLRSAVYEVQTGDRDASAFSLAAALLKGKVSINLAGNPLDNSVSISSGDFNAVLSALSSDSRFKVVSQPSLRVRSGKEATINVGAEVPVLGALSYPQGAGQAVQSVEYRSSGVIFTITPHVRAAVVDLTVDQQLSNFVQTTTGVNSSPTLTKRQLTTNVQMRNSEVIMLGGLTEEKTSETQTGLSFLPSIFRSKVTESSKSEILLVIQMVRI